MRKITLLLITLLANSFALAGDGAFVGSVDTEWKAIGPNHKIVVYAFKDPHVKGVTCHISRAKKGGLKGWVGLEEDPSNASIACRQTSDIEFDSKQVDKGTEAVLVFKESTSPLFKTINVSRFYDKANNTLVYLAWSDKVIDGSRKNSISTVTLKDINFN